MLFLTPFLTVYLLLLTGLMGLIMGSFCNAWAWRLAHGESIVHGRSHCAACGHTLAAKDLVPLVSWLCLRGRCRYCGQPISPRYPAVELISCVYYLSVVLRFDVSWTALRLLVLGSLLLTAALVDLDTMELPDGLLIAAACAAALRLITEGRSGLTDALLGALVAAVPLLLLVLLADRVMGRETMGGGDIKLMAVFGLHFGPLQSIFLLISGCVIGLLFAAVTRKKKGMEFPFGPALALAGWLTALVGQPVITWYLSLL